MCDNFEGQAFLPRTELLQLYMNLGLYVYVTCVHALLCDFCHWMQTQASRHVPEFNFAVLF